MSEPEEKTKKKEQNEKKVEEPIPQEKTIKPETKAKKIIDDPDRKFKFQQEQEFLAEKPAQPSEEVTEQPKPKQREESLEEAVGRERVVHSPDLPNSEYSLQLSRKPLRDLQDEMTNIYRITEDRGYLSWEEQRRVQYLSSAVEQKLEDVEQGKYSLTAEMAKAASLTQQLGDSLHELYHHGKKGKREGNDWYFRSG